jgi:hypothetical protein
LILNDGTTSVIICAMPFARQQNQKIVLKKYFDIPITYF